MTKIFSYDQSFKVMQDMLNDFGLGSKNNVYAKFPEPLMDCIITFVIISLLVYFAPVFYLGALGVAFGMYVLARSFKDWDIATLGKDIEQLSTLDSLYRRFPFRMISIAALLAAILTIDRSLPGRFDDVWVATGLFMACAVLTTILSDPTDSYPAESGRMWQFRMSITMAFIACGISMGPLLRDYLLSLPEGKAGTTETIIGILPPAFFAIISLLCLGGTEAKNKLLNKIARLKHVEEKTIENIEREAAAKKILNDINKSPEVKEERFDPNNPKCMFVGKDGLEYHLLLETFGKNDLTKVALTTNEALLYRMHMRSKQLQDGPASNSSGMLAVVSRNTTENVVDEVIQVRLMFQETLPGKMSSIKRQIFKAKRSTILANKR